MSTKRYCDLCEKPACEGLHGTAVGEKTGEPWTGYNGSRTCDGTWQTLIKARIFFEFENHPTGFGGPPDLCPQCAATLTRRLADKLKP